MSQLPGFIGPSAQNSSLNVNAERTVNLILDVPAGTPAASPTFSGRPGVRPFARLPGGPIRGLFSQDGRCFAVGGGFLCEILPGGIAVTRGFLGVDGNPVTICSNGAGGNQLFITSGGFGYVYDLLLNTATLITAPAFPAPCIMGDFCDGYFVALKGLSNEFHISKLEDGANSAWAPLDVAQVSESSNQLVAMIVQNRQIWLWGSKQTEPWYNSGNANFPFQPVPSTQVQMGVAAPWSVQRCDNTVFFIGLNGDGAGIVWRMNGYTPARISTFALETILQRLPRIDDAIGFTLQWEGHLFYGLYLPQNDTTWMYDVATGQWAEWAQWDDVGIRWLPYLGRCHTFAFGKHLVGSRSNEVLYQLRADAWVDELAS